VTRRIWCAGSAVKRETPHHRMFAMERG